MAKIKWLSTRVVQVVPPPIKPKTNADRIRAMSDEQLAKMITKPIGYACRKDCDIENDGCEDCVLAWLKQDAKNA